MKHIALLLSFVIFSQTAAFAIDPIATSQNSERAKIEMQRSAEKMNRRYEKMSDAKKLKFLERQEKRIAKNEERLAKMNDAKFKKVMARLETVASEADERELSAEETEVFVEGSVQITKAQEQEMAKKISQVEKSQVVSKFAKAKEMIKEEKERVLNRIAGVSTEKEANRAPAGLVEACEGYLSVVTMLAGVLWYVLLIMGVIPFGIITALAGALIALSCFIITYNDNGPGII